MFVMSRRTFKYRLYPNRRQREKLQAALDVCRELYNAALQERREAWSSHRKSIHYVAQANQRGDIKAVRDDIVVSKYLSFLAFVPRVATTRSPILRPGSNGVAVCRFRRLATLRLSCTVLSKARSRLSRSNLRMACGMPVSVAS